MSFAAPNQTRIVNAALAELGSTARVSSIDEGSNQAKRAAALWPDVLRDLLSRHPWNFAIRRAPLNLSAEAPLYGYRNRYQLPADCVRWLPRREGDRGWRKAEREGGYLLTDAEPPFEIRYIAYVDEVPRWSPTFVRAMTLLVAASLAEGITQSEGIKDRLEERAERQIAKAKRMDGLETGDTRSGGQVRRSAWLGVRRVGFYGGGWHGGRR